MGSSTATNTTNVGNTTIAASNSGLSATNYDFANLVDGTLTINKAHLTVTADNQSRAYGAANPVFAETITGFVNGENGSVVTGTGMGSSTATNTTNVGNTTIAASNSGLSATNYDFANLVDGTLTINKAHLTVTADNQSRAYGAANPIFTETVSGFVNGESATNVGLIGTATGNSTASNTTAVGNAIIVASNAGLSAANYDFANLVNSTLEIKNSPSLTPPTTIAPIVVLPKASVPIVDPIVSGANLTTQGINNSVSTSNVFNSPTTISTTPLTSPSLTKVVEVPTDNGNAAANTSPASVATIHEPSVSNTSSATQETSSSGSTSNVTNSPATSTSSLTLTKVIDVPTDNGNAATSTSTTSTAIHEPNVSSTASATQGTSSSGNTSNVTNSATTPTATSSAKAADSSENSSAASTHGSSVQGSPAKTNSTALEPSLKSGISVTLTREPSVNQSGAISVSLPKNLATAGAGFAFSLPEQIANVSTNSTSSLQVTTISGQHLPGWLKFNSETKVFTASAVPDGAFPMRVLVTTGGNQTIIVISERSE